MQALAFYFFATLTLCAATAAVVVRHPVHAILSLIAAFFGAAGLFVLLRAEFLAMLLVVVYVGAVAVLFLFVIMMLDVSRTPQPARLGGRARRCALGACAAAAVVGFCAVIIALVRTWYMSPFMPRGAGKPMPEAAEATNTYALGLHLYTDYAYGVLIAGFALLVAMIGAIVLSMRHRSDAKCQDVAAQQGRIKGEALQLKDVGTGEGVAC